MGKKIKLSVTLLTLVALVIGMSAQAQTAKWVIAPTYQHISQISDNYYVAKSNNGTGIIDRDGKIVVAMAFDSITPFAEGIALVLKKEKKKYRISSFFTEAGKQITITPDYYVEDYPFFSEGLLGVSNSKDRWGFINTQGKIAIPLEYYAVGPFCDGYATAEVSKSKSAGWLNKLRGAVTDITKLGSGKMCFINTKGQEMALDSDLGEITFASSFSNGEAYVVNKKKRVYVINLKGKVIREESMTNMDSNEYGAMAPEGMIQRSPWKKVKENLGTTRLIKEGDLYGFVQAKKTVLPPQFINASQVSNGYATVEVADHSWGVLKFGTGNITVTDKAKNAGEAKAYEIKMVVPQGYPVNYMRAEVVVDNNPFFADGKSSAPNTYVANIEAPDGKATVTVTVDKLMVYNSDFNMANAEKVLTEAETTHSIAIGATTVKATKNKTAPFSFTINNPTAQDMTMQVSVAGKGAVFKSQTVTIPANSKKSFSGYFSNAESQETRTLTIKAGDKTASYHITIKPLFVEL